jgi:hypothetical protein
LRTARFGSLQGNILHLNLVFKFRLWVERRPFLKPEPLDPEQEVFILKRY